ncbi:hypothetical protein [Deinococcus ruber]|uniref:Uncharacterized protein n=1 Tax=Deinococcus ruber TaxID=1848197 RepID=A0A918F8K0_9DEIO|nr:hypothetical protein [Deinococcus ruber]GGR11401.1 hypothetical protein GCM10008957_25210 [Deinococcus ruber]
MFTVKNPGVTNAATIQQTGTKIYWRDTIHTAGENPLDLGIVVITNRAKAQTTFDVLGNREGVDVMAKRIIKGASETITFYSKHNIDPDILALHSGSAAVVGDGSTGIDGVIGLIDTASPNTGMLVFVGQSPDDSALVQVTWFPFAQLNGNATATEDVLVYPQFEATNLAWADAFKDGVDPTLQDYVTKTNAVKILLLVPKAKLDDVLNAIFGTGTSSAPAFQVSHTYVLNDVVEPTTPNGHTYKVTTAGTTGSSEPSWATGANSTTTSGTVTFTRL